MTIQRNKGFSLIELTMVLFILGLLLSSFLAPLAARVEQQERKNTQIQLNEIEEVIYGYVLQNNYLPCPDCSDNIGGCVAATANDGVEDTVAAGAGLTCSTEIGNLPWVSLGVKGTDEWDNVFTYRVDDTFADRNDSATRDGTGCETASATLNVSFSLCSDGEIIILDGDGGNNVATNVPAIVVSHGKNWPDIDTDTAHEEENYDDAANATDTLGTFVDRDYSDDDTAGFDDMVIWISPYILRTMAVKSGILP